jgi:TRAP transporter TAXI family solute receptor
MTMGTGSPGGTYAVYGPAWGNVVQASTGVNVAYRSTQGPNQNIILLDRGGVQLGMTTLGVARQAWTGAGDWTKGTRFREVRALFPMYETPFHGLALAHSGIVRLSQLSGRIVGIGEEGGTSGTYVPGMLATLGIHPRELRFGGIGEQTGEVVEGKLDACILAGGAPLPSIVQAERRTDLHILGFTKAEVELLCATIPELTPAVLPRGTYRSQRAELPVVGMFNFAICRSDLPDDLAATITASVLDHRGELMVKAPAAAETLAANAVRNAAVPFHRGAVAYYARNGIAVPSVAEA